jgi:hypothetical protein
MAHRPRRIGAWYGIPNPVQRTMPGLYSGVTTDIQERTMFPPLFATDRLRLAAPLPEDAAAFARWTMIRCGLYPPARSNGA